MQSEIVADYFFACIYLTVMAQTKSGHAELVVSFRLCFLFSLPFLICQVPRESQPQTLLLLHLGSIFFSHSFLLLAVDVRQALER